ncbi:MAG: ankyrin repeat domain-containing protein [Natronincolaceae bacterium]|jgi:ankyrin repeat protein|nr:ankyrin repeat domain-containing protein [Bacillota bacterium]
MNKKYKVILTNIAIILSITFLVGCLNNFKNSTKLISAVKQGDIENVKYLIEKGADVNIQVPTNEATEWNPFSNRPNYYQERNTALFIAVVDDIELTKLLLENGVDLNIRNSAGSTNSTNRGTVLLFDIIKISG